MSIATDIVAAEIIVAPYTGEIEVIVDSHDVLVETANYEILVEPVGAPGKPGDPGPPGPTRVSADAGNNATLGSDSLIFVPDQTPPPESDANLSTDYGSAITAGASYQTAIGAQISMSASQPGATAVGTRTAVGGQYGVAMGYGASATGSESVAIGHLAYADLAGSVAIGTDSVGTGAHATLADQIVLGTAKHTISLAGNVNHAGLVKIDRGPGAGIPLLHLKTNNGDMILSSDSSSYLTFSGGVYIPTLAVGSITFPNVGASIDFNGASLVNVGRLIASGYIKAYNDYNAFPALADQGFAHRYSNRAVSPDAIAFQAYKDGDQTENPFRISSHGYGWLRNALGNKPVWSLRAASDQVADLQQWQDANGTAVTFVTNLGDFRTTRSIVANYGTAQMIDFDADGRLYFGSALDTNLYRSAPNTLKTDDSFVAPDIGANTVSAYMPPTAAEHVARKDYVDSRIWKGTQAAYDAIPVKDPTVLYVVAG